MLAELLTVSAILFRRFSDIFRHFPRMIWSSFSGPRKKWDAWRFGSFVEEKDKRVSFTKRSTKITNKPIWIFSAVFDCVTYRKDSELPIHLWRERETGSFASLSILWSHRATFSIWFFICSFSLAWKCGNWVISAEIGGNPRILSDSEHFHHFRLSENAGNVRKMAEMFGIQ